jgi:hypothetical protein
MPANKALPRTLVNEAFFVQAYYDSCWVGSYNGRGAPVNLAVVRPILPPQR